MTIVKVDNWVQDILCDPLSKSKLTVKADCLISDYGRRYPVVDGIYDLRVLTVLSGSIAAGWESGQVAYEEWSANLAKNSSEDYASQRRGVEDVYRAIAIEGRCLDVGGNDGRLRAFLAPEQEYLCIDPFIKIVKEPRSAECKRVYPFIDEPFNFVASMAEHLPFISNSFDTVHIRSALDHFLNPELALREAFRVLRAGGALVVGLLVKGGKTGRDNMQTRLKENARSILVGAGFNHFKDHHVWHPTYDELCGLITSTDFSIEKTHWQESQHDQVCYIRAIKQT